MIGYVLRRSAVAVVVLIGISIVTFGLLQFISPSPGRAVLGLKASPAAVASFNKTNGYDRTFVLQYFTYANHLLHGNLGRSYKLNQNVSTLIGQNYARSAYLSGVSLVLAILVAIPLGIFQAVKRNSVADYVGTAVSFTLYSMPSFFLGLLLISLLCINFHVFPVQASQSTKLIGVIKDPRSMVLPIVVLVAVQVANYSRYMRSSALDNLAQDYIRLARAKGLSERAVLSRHLLRNSILPMVTLIGLSLPALVAGNLIVEELFNFPGLGLLFYTALGNEDYPVLLAYTLLGAVLTVVGNLLADVALTVADPRIRLWTTLLPPIEDMPSAGRGPTPEGGEVQISASGWRLAFRSFAENRLALVSVLVLVAAVLFCFLGPHLYHTNQFNSNVLDTDLHPGKGHPLGTDDQGFDELGRIMKGGQASLKIGFFSAAIATVIGTLYGAVAGLIGGILDGILMRFVDVLLSIPFLFIVLILATRYNATVLSLSIILGIFSWLVPARLVRGEVLTIRTRDFVSAATVMGGTRTRLVWRHLIPNALSVVIVNITFQVADAILALAYLGFLGFGLKFPQVDWGSMLGNGDTDLADHYWWLVYPVGIVLILVVMAVNLIGDALRDTFDVRLRRR